MRSRSTSSPSSAAAIAAAAPPAYASAPQSASHSACQAPPRARAPGRATLRARRLCGGEPRARAREHRARPGFASAASWTIRRPAPRAPRRPRSARADEVEPDLPADACGACRARRRALRCAPVRVPRKRPARRGRARVRAAATHAARPSPSAASVPGCAAELNGQAFRSRLEPSRRASRSATSQPAALSPKVVGTACWSSVRAGHRRRRGAPRPGPRSRPRPPPPRIEHEREGAARDEHRRGVHDVLTRRAPVDEPACSPPTSARSARTSGSAGLPTARPCVERGRGSRTARHGNTRRSPRPRRAGRCPPRPRRARAPSRSPASPRARRDRRQRRAARRGRRAARTPSYREERRLPVALEADVEAQPSVLGTRHERRALLGVEARGATGSWALASSSSGEVHAGRRRL